jgi:hypothetical protein
MSKTLLVIEEAVETEPRCESTIGGGSIRCARIELHPGSHYGRDSDGEIRSWSGWPDWAADYRGNTTSSPDTISGDWIH